MYFFSDRKTNGSNDLPRGLALLPYTFSLYRFHIHYCHRFVTVTDTRKLKIPQASYKSALKAINWAAFPPFLLVEGAVRHSEEGRDRCVNENSVGCPGIGLSPRCAVI